MPDYQLHHISVPTRDAAIAGAFYEDVLGLAPLPRPDFPFDGRWYALGDRQLHLIANPGATRRTAPGIDPLDTHFALRVADIEPVLARLAEHGYGEDAAPERRLRVIRQGPAGFAQVFLLDPDYNIIEINAAPMPG